MNWAFQSLGISGIFYNHALSAAPCNVVGSAEKKGELR